MVIPSASQSAGADEVLVRLEAVAVDFNLHAHALVANPVDAVIVGKADGRISAREARVELEHGRDGAEREVDLAVALEDPRRAEAEEVAVGDALERLWACTRTCGCGAGLLSHRR